MSVEQPEPAPIGRPARRRSRLRWLMLLTLATVAWTAWFLFSQQASSATLPEGVRVEYHSSSSIVSPGSGRIHYSHPAPQADSHILQDYWKKARDWLPSTMASHLPEWKYYEAHFPRTEHLHSRELRLRVHGNYSPSDWNIYLADENGWESAVNQVIWGDDTRFEQGAGQRSSWIRLGTPLPLRSEKLRLRFRPVSSNETLEDGTQIPPPFTEIVIHNPFHLDLPITPGKPLPISKNFSDVTFTLEKVTRDRVVGGIGHHGVLSVEFTLKRGATPLENYFAHIFEVTDSSGQFFHSPRITHASEGGRYRISVDTAPWSDDACWRLRFVLHHVRIQSGTNVREVIPKDEIKAEFSVQAPVLK